MTASVLLNLLNDLRDEIKGFPSIVLLFSERVG